MYLYTFLKAVSDSMATRVSVVSPLLIDTRSNHRPLSTSSQSSDQHKSADRKKLLVTLSSLSPNGHQAPQAGSNRGNKVRTSLNVKPASSSEQKFTDGKGFLHYAVSATDQQEEELKSQDDTVSCASSFKMDSDVLSLENAEFSLQTYNNNYLAQRQSD